MKLLYQTHSPYARKVLVFAHEIGLAGQIEVIHQETSPTLRNEQVYAENPVSYTHLDVYKRQPLGRSTS